MVTRYECQFCHDNYKSKNECLAHIRKHRTPNTRAARKINPEQTIKQIDDYFIQFVAITKNLKEVKHETTRTLDCCIVAESAPL